MTKSILPFDEMKSTEDALSSGVRAPYQKYNNWLQGEEPKRLAAKAAECETVFRRTGITFAVYGDSEAAERIIPFDIVPRIIAAAE
ncbi:MAG: circularly permuted type 2 ATP-grasp protein, partial [Notoacmeibacter sp.]